MTQKTPSPSSPLAARGVDRVTFEVYVTESKVAGSSSSFLKGLNDILSSSQPDQYILEQLRDYVSSNPQVSPEEGRAASTIIGVRELHTREFSDIKGKISPREIESWRRGFHDMAAHYNPDFVPLTHESLTHVYDKVSPKLHKKKDTTGSRVLAGAAVLLAGAAAFGGLHYYINKGNETITQNPVPVVNTSSEYISPGLNSTLTSFSALSSSNSSTLDDVVAIPVEPSVEPVKKEEPSLVSLTTTGQALYLIDKEAAEQAALQRKNEQANKIAAAFSTVPSKLVRVEISSTNEIVSREQINYFPPSNGIIANQGDLEKMLAFVGYAVRDRTPVATNSYDQFVAKNGGDLKFATEMENDNASRNMYNNAAESASEFKERGFVTFPTITGNQVIVATDDVAISLLRDKVKSKPVESKPAQSTQTWRKN